MNGALREHSFAKPNIANPVVMIRLLILLAGLFLVMQLYQLWRGMIRQACTVLGHGCVSLSGAGDRRSMNTWSRRGREVFWDTCCSYVGC